MQPKLWLLDAGDAESRYALEPADTLTADRIFERRWALLLLDRSVERLRAEHEAVGKLALFNALKASLTGSRESQPYSELATQLVSILGHDRTDRDGRAVRESPRQPPRRVARERVVQMRVQGGLS